MKILFITGSLNQGGAEYQILELAKLFQEKRHEIKVFAISDYSFYKPFIINNNLNYSHLLNSQNSLKRIFLTLKKVRDEKPDLIISYLKRVSQVALFAKIFSGVKTKIIVGERTSDIQPRYDQYHFYLMQFANFITVNSISKLEYLKSNFPRLKNKLIFFSNIIDIEKFSFIEKKYNKSILTIGYVGRISPEKNIINLIKAIKLLKDRGALVELFLHGATVNTNYTNKVKELIKKYKIQDVVLIKGKTNDVLKVYKRIDLLCLISDYEGFSNVISEAISCGLPIITSDISENRYLVEDNINGFVVNHKDPLSISEGIEKYIKLSINKREDMAIQNRKKAEILFDKEMVYKNYMALIDKL